MSNTAIAYIDGSGNSGGIETAACILHHADATWERTIVLPKGTTNNVGEYNGALLAVRYAKELEVDDLRIYSDSKLIVNQLNGDWRCQDNTLRGLRDRIWREATSFSKISIEWIPREENFAADALCRRAKLEAERAERKSNANPFAKTA